MRRNIVHAALAILMASLPASAYASLLISEVSYDPPGTDSKREWIEVENVGSDSIQMSLVRFVESGVAHKIAPFGQSAGALAPGQFAVIADDPSAFLLDYPSFSGLLFDSAFSLTNTGELLSLTIDSVEVDSVAYVSTDGAAGTGASLTRVTTGFMSARPTPGSRNESVTWDGDESDEEVPGNSSGSSGATSTSTHSSPIVVSTYVPKVDFQVHAGRDRSVSINTPIKIEATAKGAPEGFGARWSFGDGTFSRGVSAEKQYKKEGVYVVVLNAIARGVREKSVDRLMVDVLEPKVSVVVDDSEYVITNETGTEINLGGFTYRVDKGSSKAWVEDTILLAGSAVRVPAILPTPCGLKISYPNGVELLPINCGAAVQSPHDGYP